MGRLTVSLACRLPADRPWSHLLVDPSPSWPMAARTGRGGHLGPRSGLDRRLRRVSGGSGGRSAAHPRPARRARSRVRRDCHRHRGDPGLARLPAPCDPPHALPGDQGGRTALRDRSRREPGDDGRADPGLGRLARGRPRVRAGDRGLRALQRRADRPGGRAPPDGPGAAGGPAPTHRRTGGRRARGAGGAWPAHAPIRPKRDRSTAPGATIAAREMPLSGGRGRPSGARSDAATGPLSHEGCAGPVAMAANARRQARSGVGQPATVRLQPSSRSIATACSFNAAMGA